MAFKIPYQTFVMCKTDMCLAWVQSFSKLRQNTTNLWNFKHALVTPGTSEHSRKHQTYNDTSSSIKVILSWIPGQPKPQNMSDVLGEHQFIMFENFETIYFSRNWTVPFMSQSFIAGLAPLCHFMPNDGSLCGSSLIPSIPPWKLLCGLKLALYTHHKVHMSCFCIKTFLLGRHTPNGHILL